MFVPIQPYLLQLLSGTLTTIALMLCALALGLFLAIIFSLINTSQYAALKWPVKIYSFIIRGTPLLVQFFLIYFGLSQFDWLRNSIFWVALKEPFVCAVLALAINTSAYTTVLLTGAIKAVPRGEKEACDALGMSWFMRMRLVILPRAFRLALPAYSNEVVMILKGTSLASTITLLDLMGVTQRIIADTYASIEFLLLAGAIYLILNVIIMAGFRYLEGRWVYVR